jgi:5-methyltetrahydropteroyltriglutamate--homocysteine methyltransferase
MQIDEPVWVGCPGDLPWLTGVFNDMIRGIDAAFTLHLCYGNYQLRRLFTGEYADLFPALLAADAAELSMEFAVHGMRETELFARHATEKRVVVGVIDVKDAAVETPGIVADRIRAALRHIPAERMLVSPDCGMKFMPRDRAFAKLCALADGARIVRRELEGA